MILACLFFSYLQFNEKGFLFNNAYIYASKQEREVMDKKPHYRQSGIVFLMVGIIFALINSVSAMGLVWILNHIQKEPENLDARLDIKIED